MSTESMTTTGAAVPQAAADGVTNPKGIGLFRMVTTVITLIVGAGVFSLSGDAAAGGASGWAILTAWGISAIGVFCLVMTFFALSRVKPDLKGGIYTYAAHGIRRLPRLQQCLGLLDLGPSVHGQLLGASVRRAVVLLPDLR